MLTLLEIFFDFLGQQRFIGQGAFNIYQAITYVIMVSPRHIYDIYPIICLCSTVITLNLFTQSSELVIYRGLGYSMLKITSVLLCSGLIITICMSYTGEFFAPRLKQKAEFMRDIALTGNSSLYLTQKLWLREDNNFIFIQQASYDGLLRNIVKYNLHNNQLQQIIYADKAEFINDNWQLYNITKVDFQQDKMQVTKLKTATWHLIFKPKLIKIFSIKPADLSLRSLHSFVSYRRQAGLIHRYYEYYFWQKLFTPFLSLFMTMIAIPFSLGHNRSGRASLHLLLSILLGLFIFILRNILASAVQIYNISGIFAALLPLCICFVIWIVGCYMRRD